MKRLLLSLVIAPLGLQAAGYYLQVNTPAGSNWNTSSIWFSQQAGGGTNPTGLSSHDFFLNGFSLRADIADFAGQSLSNDAIGGILLVQTTSKNLSVFNVTAQGSLATYAAGSEYAFRIGALSVNSTLNLRPPAISSGSGKLTLTVTSLSGPGLLAVGGGSGGSTPGAASKLFLQVNEAGNFTGTIAPTIGSLAIAAAVNFPVATLLLDGSKTATVNLAADTAVGALRGVNFANGFTVLPVGQYSATALNTTLGANLFSGTGQLSVVPKPAFAVAKTGEWLLDNAGLNFATGEYGLCPNDGGHAKILSFNNYQYAFYYNAARHTCLARRKISPPSAWQVIEFTDYDFLVNDTHNGAHLGICAEDGTIHLAWDHHVSPLHYRRSALGAATAPDQAAWNASLFSPTTSVLLSGTGETQVTYPAFIDPLDGSLKLVMRIGTSGEGDSYIYGYSPSTHTWTSRRMFVSRQGNYQGGTSRNAYFSSPILYENLGTSRLYASWVWRETTDAVTNHDLQFATSDNDGATWKDSDGNAIAVSGSTPMRVDTAGLTFWPIAMGSGLSNGNSAAVDGSGQYHMLVAQTRIGGTDKVYYHYWRATNGAWNRALVSGLSLNTSNLLRMLFDSNDNAYIVYQAANDLRIAASSRASDWTDWSLLYSDNSRDYEQPSVDLGRWRGDGIVSVFIQQAPATPGASSKVYSQDFAVGFQSVEAEGFSNQSGCVIATQYAGYTGTGYVDMGGNTSYAQWSTINTGAGARRLIVRYANGTGSNLSCSLSVNGLPKGTIDFPPTGAWTQWSTVTIPNVVLSNGNNVVRLTSNTSNGGSNLDRIVLQ